MMSMSGNALYRGKDIDVGDWVEGYYIEEDGYSFILEGDGIGSDGNIKCVEVWEWSVSKYTGLKDLMDRKIFVMDIVKDHSSGHVGIVMFGRHNMEYGYYIHWLSEKAKYYREDILFWTEVKKIEVIGNIFDKDVKDIDI